MKKITWKAVEVEVTKIKPTPNNFKLKTEEGLSRFETSTKNYGLAGSVILNSDYTLIDGNTRWEKAKKEGLKKIWASMPSRKLTPKEFTEFAAMYDMARAGEVDIKRIQDELGTSKDFFKKWGLEDISEEAIQNLAELEKADIKKRDGKKKEEATTIQKPLTLLFTVEENEEFIRIAESLYSKYKVDNVTDLALKVFRAAKKLK
jgi:hypothetical protein